MSNKIIYMMCGVAGVGKSSYIAQNMKDGDAVVSRDQIRVAMTEDGDEYFDHEDEVFDTFIDQINRQIRESSGDIWIDATHITPKSRRRVLQRIYTKDCAIYCIYINGSLNTCLSNNERRRDTKAYVPRNVIRRMYESFVIPTRDEGFTKVIVVNKGAYNG